MTNSPNIGRMSEQGVGVDFAIIRPGTTTI